MTSAFDGHCTYFDPETGAPCLKAPGHEPSPHLTHRSADGTPTTRIEPLENFKTVEGGPVPPIMSSAYLDGVLSRPREFPRELELKYGETFEVKLPMRLPCRYCKIDLRGGSARLVEPHENEDGETAYYLACEPPCSKAPDLGPEPRER